MRRFAIILSVLVLCGATGGYIWGTQPQWRDLQTNVRVLSLAAAVLGGTVPTYGTCGSGSGLYFTEAPASQAEMSFIVPRCLAASEDITIRIAVTNDDGSPFTSGQVIAFSYEYSVASPGDSLDGATTTVTGSYTVPTNLPNCQVVPVDLILDRDDLTNPYDPFDGINGFVSLDAPTNTVVPVGVGALVRFTPHYTICDD